MKIPSSLKLGNVTYTVSSLKSDNPQKMGESSEQDQTIKLKESLSKEKKEETFFHEVIHQILDCNDYIDDSGNEKLVTCLGNGIYQVLKENDLLKND